MLGGKNAPLITVKETTYLEEHIWIFMKGDHIHSKLNKVQILPSSSSQSKIGVLNLKSINRIMGNA